MKDDKIQTRLGRFLGYLVEVCIAVIVVAITVKVVLWAF